MKKGYPTYGEGWKRPPSWRRLSAERREHHQSHTEGSLQEIQHKYQLTRHEEKSWAIESVIVSTLLLNVDQKSPCEHQEHQ